MKNVQRDKSGREDEAIEMEAALKSRDISERGKSIQSSVHPHHSTFLVQVLFFTLVLFENVLLAAYPLMKGHNMALRCLGEDKILFGSLIIVILCIASWVFQALNITH